MPPLSASSRCCRPRAGGLQRPALLLPLLLLFPSGAEAVLERLPCAVEFGARLRGTRQTAVKPIHLRIDGRWYDVGAWADKHPGGRYVLEWCDGYDVTGAFHSVHLFGKVKAADILRRLPQASLADREVPPPELPQIQPVPVAELEANPLDLFMLLERAVQPLLSRAATVEAPGPAAAAAAAARGRRRAAAAAPPVRKPIIGSAGLPWHEGSSGTAKPPVYNDTALKLDLEAMLHRRFRSPAEYKATPEHWARIVGALVLFCLCFAGYLHGDIGSTLVLPFAQWLLFSPTVHEASHSTLSTDPRVNHAATFCALPFVYNPYIWFHEHIVSHHQYTNDERLDVDLHHLRPARLHAGSEPDPLATGYNFLFKGFFTTAGMSILWPVRALLEQPTARYRNLVTPAPAAVSKLSLLLSFLPTLFVLLWPWCLVASGAVGAGHGFFLWLYPWIVTSVIWTVLTQISHVQEDCQRPPTDADDFFRWQIESAVDYSVHDPMVSKLTATLNLQSMHHVMPSVCGCHFPDMYDEYAAICERHGVRLNTRANVIEAWKTCVDHVFELSVPSGSGTPLPEEEGEGAEA